MLPVPVLSSAGEDRPPPRSAFMRRALASVTGHASRTGVSSPPVPTRRGTMSGSELVFHTNPMSRGRRVRWMLEELGVEYCTVVQAYGTGMKSAEYLAVNPLGKWPRLQHRGGVVAEAAAVCAYRADAFPQAGLAPAPEDPLRGPYLRWMFFAAGPVEAAVTARARPPAAGGEGGLRR